jgi:hypothetical protein
LTKKNSKRAAKKFISALKIFVQFFSRILAFFRNNYFIDAYSVFRWCFTTEICVWETKEWFKIFKYTLNRNGAELFGILHLGTILHLRKCTLRSFISLPQITEQKSHQIYFTMKFVEQNSEWGRFGVGNCKEGTQISNF